jgi:nicotinamidase-related amidase
VDLINPFDFSNAEALLRETRAIVSAVTKLRRSCAEADVPIIYVNDNFGQWRSSFEQTFVACARRPGGDIARALRPGKKDYFVLKPHRSGFFGTPLELLLRSLDVRSILLCGIATDMCVLSTAHDARLRDFDTYVASDGTASFDARRHQAALSHLDEALQIPSHAGHVLFEQLRKSGESS